MLTEAHEVKMLIGGTGVKIKGCDANWGKIKKPIVFSERAEVKRGKTLC